MDNEYITNLNTEDLNDEEIVEKLKKADNELSKVKSELDEKSKLCLEQKHKLDELSLENNNLKEENKNLQNLVNFYESVEKKDNSEPEEKEKIKELEIKIMNLNEKIKELEEKMIIKENDL